MNKTMTAVGVDMTLDQIRDTINSLTRQGSTANHQIGTLYNHVVDRRLAEIAGYKNAQAYFIANVKGLSQSTLSVYGAVARNFTEAVCTQYGMGNLRELLRYADAANTAIPEDPGAMSIQVPQEDGKVVTKSFAECSVDELERGTRAQRAPPVSRVPIADQARLLFLEDSIFTRFSGVAQVRFSSRSQGGKTLVSLQDVPMTELVRLTQAIQDGINAEPTLSDEETLASA
jgi:hypothetical protein